MERWVSFEKLRKELSFVKLFEFHNLRLTRNGEQFVGACPLPGHGRDSKKTFSANAQRGIFQCFKCGARGNIIDFAVLMANRNPNDGTDVRKTALELQERFLSSDIIQQSDEKKLSQIAANADKIVVNGPIDFELKGLDEAHPYLTGRGFTKETIRFFGLGFCNRGWLKGRVAIPLHDSKGQLLGYAGRLVENDPHTPKYMLPGERERKGQILRFEKSLFLYNGHRIKAAVPNLVVVEGFPSVWWLHQNGYPETVALMGNSFSVQQLDLILNLTNPAGNVWIIADGDFGGRRGLGLLAQQLVTKRLTRLVSMPDGKQPTDLSAEELRGLFPFGRV
jgi:DNA primase